MHELPFVDEWSPLPNCRRASADVIIGGCKKVTSCGTETTLATRGEQILRGLLFDDKKSCEQLLPKDAYN